MREKGLCSNNESSREHREHGYSNSYVSSAMQNSLGGRVLLKQLIRCLVEIEGDAIYIRLIMKRSQIR